MALIFSLFLRTSTWSSQLFPTESKKFKTNYEECLMTPSLCISFTKLLNMLKVWVRHSPCWANKCSYLRLTLLMVVAWISILHSIETVSVSTSLKQIHSSKLNCHTPDQGSRTCRAIRLSSWIISKLYIYNTSTAITTHQ